MIDATSPLLASLGRARSQSVFDRSAVPLLLFERYRRAVRQRTTPGASARPPAGFSDDLRTRLASSGGASTRADELLLALLDAVELMEGGDGVVAQGALAAAYAAWVEYAITVYDAGDGQAATYIVAQVGADAELSGHVALATRARQYEAFLALREARIEESEALFRRAEQLARRSRSMSQLYRARIGRANLMRLRGNLPAAEAMLDRVVRAARRHAPDVAPRALLMRANVAHARGNFAAAVSICATALHESDDERIRARILIELAFYMAEFSDTELGDFARQILEHAAVRSPEHATRRHAGINLLALAVDQRRRDDFATWRATLRPAALSPRQAIDYALYTVRGLHAFSLPDDPIPYLDEADRVAAEHGLSQFTFQIAEARERVAQAAAGRAELVAAPAARPLSSAPPEVHTAARRVTELLATSVGTTASWGD